MCRRRIENTNKNKSKNKSKNLNIQGTLDDLDKKKFDPNAYINMVRAIGGGKKGAALDKEILARRAAKKREKWGGG